MASTLTERIASRVRRELTAAARTQTDLATSLGMTQPSLSRRLSGAIPWPVEELEPIAKFFGITINDLIS